MLAFYHSILVLDKTSGNIVVGLEFFKLGHTDNVLTNLHDFELQFFVFNGKFAQLIAQGLGFHLHLFDLSLLRIGLLLELGLILLVRVDLD